ncbi:hypothetical protein BDZ97DRAFT_1123753 [Flammula alnicola]|nr:hypothetical protein BDZ97DRAFT_1123753 [Flammula alnicola]
MDEKDKIDFDIDYDDSIRLLPTFLPCYCPNCKGELRDSKTVKKHAKKDTAIALASAQDSDARKDEYERAKLYGDQVDNGMYREEDDGISVSLEEDVAERGSERPNKRRRLDDEDVNAHEADGSQRSAPNDEYADENQTGNSTDNFWEPSPEVYNEIDQQALDKTKPFPWPERNVHGPDSESEESEPLQEPESEDEEEEELRARTEALNLLNNLVPDEEDDLQPDNNDEEDSVPSSIEHLKIAQSFIEAIKNATLDNGKLDASATERLRNPDEEIIDISDPDTRFSLDLYMSCTNASEATYNSVRQSILRRFPETDILSHYLAKKLVSDISGVVSVCDDMCINSCHAFTGPFADLDACTMCSEPRYTYIGSGRRQKKVPRQQACTLPLGP